MKYLKTYNESYDSSRDEIEKFLREKCSLTCNSGDYRDGRQYGYEIDPNGVINVKGSVKIHPLTNSLGNINSWPPLKKIPYKFGQVTNQFICTSLGLTTLENTPDVVGGAFNCTGNNLTSLEHGPSNAAFYYCCGNPLTSLVGGPKELEEYWCGDGFGNLGIPQNRSARFTNLVGVPQNCWSFAVFGATELTSLEGAPESFFDFKIWNAPKLVDIGNWSPPLDTEFGYLKFYDINKDNQIHTAENPFIMKNNYLEPLANLMALFDNMSDFLDFMQTFPCIRGNKIDKRIFHMACADFGITPPKNLRGYDFV